MQYSLHSRVIAPPDGATKIFGSATRKSRAKITRRRSTCMTGIRLPRFRTILRRFEVVLWRSCAHLEQRPLQPLQSIIEIDTLVVSELELIGEEPALIESFDNRAPSWARDKPVMNGDMDLYG
jgi:hypothetical protein